MKHLIFNNKMCVYSAGVLYTVTIKP